MPETTNGNGSVVGNGNIVDTTMATDHGVKLAAKGTKIATGQKTTFDTRTFHWVETKAKKPTRPEDPYTYLAGFGNEHQSEFIPGALPIGQNSPQRCNYGLYAEQITGSSFAADRAHSQRNFMYRRRPAAVHDEYTKVEDNPTLTANFLPTNNGLSPIASQISWSAFKIPNVEEDGEVDFTMGLHTLGGSGNPACVEGFAYHTYGINSSMRNKAMVNADGDFLIVAQEGHLDITTEFGHLYLQPSEICVIQKGLRFKVDLVSSHSPLGARGLALETWGTRWELPELGPLGGYGLANSRDFLFPTADIDTSSTGKWTILTKQIGRYYASTQSHTPFDVVAWHGTYVPYKYDLSKFIPQNAAAVDHTDPSINTVLTCPSLRPFTPLLDLLTFNPRWDVAESTFRPPYFHRNSASEFLYKIFGAGGGRSEVFVAGGGSYEAGFTPHGSADARTIGAMHAKLQPMRIGQGQIIVMLESSRNLLFTDWGLKGCGVVAAEDTKASAWDAVPDNFGKDEEAIGYLKSMGRI